MTKTTKVEKGKIMKMTPSEAIVETLVAEGVKDMYGILGSAFMDMLDLLPTAGIRFLPVRHEQSSAHIADAYTRVTGVRSEEHTSELQSRGHLVCRLLLEKKNHIQREYQKFV